jgi:hypothetical protein
MRVRGKEKERSNEVSTPKRERVDEEEGLIDGNWKRRRKEKQEDKKKRKKGKNTHKT